MPREINVNEFERRREKIISDISRYKELRHEFIGKYRYYDNEVNRLLDKNSRALYENRIKEISGRLTRLNEELKEINKKISAANKVEAKKNAIRYFILFLSIVGLVGVFILVERNEFGITGFAVGRGEMNVTKNEYQPSFLIGGNATIELKKGDHIPNDSMINVSFWNYSNFTIFEYFLYAMDYDCANSTIEQFNNTENTTTSPWIGVSGYGYNYNNTVCESGDYGDGGNLTVVLDKLFPLGAMTPSMGGQYIIMINLTNGSENSWEVVSSRTPIIVGNWLEINITKPSPNENITKSSTFNLSVDVQCKGITGGNCRNITGFARYNGTSAIPNMIINVTALGPAFSTNTKGQSCSNVNIATGQNCTLSWIINATGNSSRFMLDVNISSSVINVTSNESTDVLVFINEPPGTPSLHKPNDKDITALDTLTVQLNWSNVTDIERDYPLSYYLEVWNNSDATGFMYANASITERTNVTSALVTFPNETNDYFWRVLASDAYGRNSSFSALRNITIQVNRAPSVPVLHKPDNFNISELNMLTSAFNWSNSSDPEGDAITYYLEVWNNSAATQFMYANASITERGNTTTANVTFPNQTGDYFWRVLASDGRLNSSFTGLRNYSVLVNRYPTAPQLNAPLNNTIMPVNQLEINLNWSNSSDPDGDQITYYLEIWNNSDLTGFMYANASVRETANVTVANVTFPNETNDYFWRVLASDGRLNSSWSDLWNVTINVTATTGNSIPQITFVSGVPAVIATEAGVTYTEISFIVNDTDGSSNLNDSSGQVRFMNNSVPITRINYTCAKVNNPTTFSGNYTCRVDLWYFDQPVNYTINVTFGDVNGARTENSSTQL
ncbi:hypothetical protein HY500_00450, partial [Candidatus Woesearchaeota archaeon]|nr:hypothetical protein [Candidatus Woesearchaeota archaeon]